MKSKRISGALSGGAALVLLLAGLFTVGVREAAAGLVGALDISGISLVASGGEVTAYFAGSAAAFDSTIRLDSPCCSVELFPNHATLVGTSFSVGAFTAGTSLVFRLHVVTTGDNWFTGPASSNVDNIVHAGIGSWVADASIPVSGTFVGFEDLFGGGDRDYDDHQFVFTAIRSQQVPEPPIALLLLGITYLCSQTGCIVPGS